MRPLHVALCTMCVWCLQRTEKGFGLAGTVFADGCELPCGGLDIETWSSARTTDALATEPSLQSLYFNKKEYLL